MRKQSLPTLQLQANLILNASPAIKIEEAKSQQDVFFLHKIDNQQERKHPKRVLKANQHYCDSSCLSQ
jgi:hypothetical protein